MTSLDSFPWPLLPGSLLPPRWNGRAFHLGGEILRVLAYQSETSHWTADLTSLHEAEAGRDHPIDRASRHLAVSSMQRIAVTSPVILDVGCSSGFVLEDLRKGLPRAHLIGADYLRGPLDGLALRMPELPILQFDLRKCPLPDACVDGVTCLNVLEHIDDHVAALAEIHRILKPGGVSHIEVPAGPALYDVYDDHLMHHRRYKLKELVCLSEAQRFDVLKGTHLGFFPFPAFYLAKKRNQRKRTLSVEEKAEFVARQIRQTRRNALFALLMSVETFFDRFVSYPTGIRCVVVLRKKT